MKNYPLLTALRERRSRRLGLGMRLPGGPLAFASRHQPEPLTEDQEAMLSFAACGITGPALADLNYAAGGGGSIMAGLVGRAVASGAFPSKQLSIAMVSRSPSCAPCWMKC